MKKKIDDYIRKPYTRILIPNDDGTYSAEILEFSGCFADGVTANEAMDNLTEAARSWIEACLEQGLDIPEPFMNQDFGGKVALRLPKSLHRQAVRFAERDGTSLNQFLVSAIAAKVGAEDSFARLLDKFEQKLSTASQNVVLVQYLNYTQNVRASESNIVNLPGDYLNLPGTTTSTRVRQDA
jgi:predicted RNase H-like HicB family nuclease